MKITMIERPRASGKTSLLKLKVHESIHEYDVVVVLGNSSRSTRNLRDYFESFNYNIKFSLKAIEHMDCKRCLIVIDEPFLIAPNVQEEMFQIFNKVSRSNDVELWGIGTVMAKEKPVFEQFIENENKH